MYAKQLRGRRSSGLCRLSRLFGAALHSSEGHFNYRSERDFRLGIRRLRKWYRRCRRRSRWRRGIVRDARAPLHLGGRRVALSRKARAHLKRLLKPLRVEGMMQWRRIALAARDAGVPCQSGTVAVERMWSMLQQMMDKAITRLSPRWFKVLSQLMFVRYNFKHFRVNLRGVADRDPKLEQRIETMEMLAAAALDATDGGSLDHLSPLYDPFLEV
jgi:hypothetical protein